MTKRFAVLIAAALVAAASPASAGPALTLAKAKSVGAAAAAEARRLNAGGAIAVVDAGGHLLYLERLDDTFPAAATVSIEKARTAATFRRPTRDFENAIKNGRVSLVGVDVMTPLQGGVPLMLDGQVVGAVGVSGAMSAEQDDDIAKVAAAALGIRASGTAGTAGTAGMADIVSQFGAARVRAAFAKGEPLLENRSYKIHASRREAPGMAEVHVRDTDIIYVLEGGATLVTGGTVVDGREIATDEIRGAKIAGGDARPLAAGDVVVVPAGTPHWFEKVKGPFLYYVVKVTL